jgi:hypothetical protein
MPGETWPAVCSVRRERQPQLPLAQSWDRAPPGRCLHTDCDDNDISALAPNALQTGEENWESFYALVKKSVEKPPQK